MTGRPLPLRTRVRLAIALLVAVWATQTLVSQWGYGGEVSAGEKFVPAGPSRGGIAGATLELREEASVYGHEVRLKQIFRWSDRDAAALAPLADLVVLRFDGRASYRSVTLAEVKTLLREAGINLAPLRFTGSTACTVARADAQVNEAAALQQWIDAKQGAAAHAPREDAASAAVPAAAAMPRPVPPAASSAGVRTLRDVLAADLCQRLGVAPDALQLAFNPKDAGVLNLGEPRFRFNLTPKRVRDLGPVSWDVTVLSDNDSRKLSIDATARAWQTQVVAKSPLAFKQVIQPSDLEERRALAEDLPASPLVTIAQAVGQQAARDLKAGTVLTAQTVEAVPLAKPGQLIAVNVAQGAVRIKTVARAMEGGSYGQAIRVRNESTRDVFTVVLTGPQEGTIGPVEADAEARRVQPKLPVASAAGR